MAQQASRFWNVGRIIGLFRNAGCTIHDAEPTVILEDGDCYNVRYLRHPTSDAFVAIQDLLDSDSISTPEVRYWERRLGMDILPD